MSNKQFAGQKHRRHCLELLVDDFRLHMGRNSSEHTCSKRWFLESDGSKDLVNDFYVARPRNGHMLGYTTMVGSTRNRRPI